MAEENQNQDSENQNDAGAGDQNADNGLMNGGGGKDENSDSKDTGDNNSGGDSDNNQADGDSKDESGKDGDRKEAEIPEEIKALGTEFAESFKKIAEAIPEDKRDELAKLGTEYQKVLDSKQEEFWKNQNHEWLKDLKADKDFGGDKLEVTATGVNRLFSKFDPDGELTGYLEKMNHQNCAPLFKMLARIAPHFQEDNFENGDRGGKDKNLPQSERMGYDTEAYK